ncbi:MAG: AraC family transcriptional regulator [Lachnospiraceae bacterium]|nr:AraC family transcriptional regulator [Lachnospiraceae bacterium]
MNIISQSMTNLVCRQYTQQTYLENDYSTLPRPHYSFAYVLEGRLEALNETVTITARPGDILFIPYQEEYRLRWICNPRSSCISCHFNFPSFVEPFGNKVFTLQKLTGFEHKRSEFEYLRDNIKNEQQAMGVLGAFYCLCNELYPHLEVSKEVHLDDRIQCAVDYININFRTSFSVEEIAGLAHLGVSRFHECFKQETGMTVIEYKNSVAVKHAALLLLDGDRKSIEEISSECGFHSAEYFRRVFRTHTGKSPKEYRKDWGIN